MGQKINPVSIRIGINKTWNSRWYRENGYAKTVGEDIKIRKLLKKKLENGGVSKIDIERGHAEAVIIIHTAKPGVIIGRGGSGTMDLKKLIEKLIDDKIKIDIVEIRNPEANAMIVASSIKSQLERRIAYKRAMKQAIDKAVAAKVKGIKIQVSGRLNGAEIARSEKKSVGRVPLTTFRSDIDYGFAEANTTYGTIGIKVWIYKGEKRDYETESQFTHRVSG